jgi:Ca-activated chloride channel family protein
MRFSRSLAITLAVCAVAHADNQPRFHSSDTSFDQRIDFSELLRGIQYYNSDGYHCEDVGATEDGYGPGDGVTECARHSADYLQQDWRISLSELLRLVQMYNSLGYTPGGSGEDTFELKRPGQDLLSDLLLNFRTYDTSKDFRLSLEEAQVPHPAFDAVLLDRLDADADDLVSRFEIYAAQQESDDDTAPVITLLGDAVITIPCGTPFVDPGVTAFDDLDGDLTAAVRGTVGQLNTHIGGIQELRYVVVDRAWNVATATRTVNVVDNTAPTLTLIGAAELTVQCGTVYKDAGAQASDDCQGNWVIKADAGAYDAGTPGDYLLSYTAVDGAGNTSATLTRTLHVVDATKPRLTLLGDSVISLPIGTPFVDPGAQVSDTCDEAVVLNVDSSSVDTNSAGVYSVSYHAEDASGNVRDATRQVTVYDPALVGFVQVNLLDCYSYDFDVSPAPISGDVYWQGGMYAVGTEVTLSWPSYYWMNIVEIEGIDVSDLVVDDSLTVTVQSGTLNVTLYSYDCAYYYEGEGLPEGEGTSEGTSEGSVEGTVDGEGSTDGEETQEGEGEGNLEGEGEGELPDIFENPFVRVNRKPLSTFSVDVDTGAYSLARRYLLENHSFPPADKVRIEEMLNYFDYDYPLPTGQKPFSVTTELTECPWTPGHRLMQIGLKAYDLDDGERRPANLIFLLDVSGSMSGAGRLPLVKQAMSALVENQLGPEDSVGIVTFSNTAQKKLNPIACTPENRQLILNTISSLSAGGSTNGSQALEFAYAMGQEQFQRRGSNRIILCSDGDFNVGQSDLEGLTAYVAEQSKDGMALTTLGFGLGNLRDDLMESMADNGNGNYAYIDTFNEAYRTLVEESQALFQIVAKDVKIQVEFNPGAVEKYRLIGYENRRLRNGDFDNDNVDAGEIGAGHTVTALYELIPVEEPGKDLSYLDVVGFVDLRFKRPNEDTSRLISYPAVDLGFEFDWATPDLMWASSVASFGMLLRGSAYSGDADWNTVRDTATRSIGADPFNYRNEFLDMVDAAQEIDD